VFIPYFKFISEDDKERLWNVCNENKWFDFRRKYLDEIITTPRWQKMWNEAEDSFNNFADSKKFFRIDNYIENFIRIGIPWSVISKRLFAWLSNSCTIDAL
jgi:hypothetical protein